MLGNLQVEFMHQQHIREDEEEKQNLVLNVAKKEFASSSEFEAIRNIALAMESGASLQAHLIAGGKTNYSYRLCVAKKLSLEELDDNEDELPIEYSSVYAKLFLPYALWDTQHNFQFDLSRAKNEYEILKLLSTTIDSTEPDEPRIVATPYLILDASSAAAMSATLPTNNTTQATLVVAEWKDDDEQWANQFIDGEVDMRVLIGVARALAQVNLHPVDPHAVRNHLLAIGPMVKSVYAKILELNEQDCDSVMKLLQTLGQEKFDALIDAHGRQMHDSPDVVINEPCGLCHNDFHPFNILVEPKPADFRENPFGPQGKFVICDWEMAWGGPLGKDAGVLVAYPAACALCFAAQGQKEVANELLFSTLEFWEAYSQTLVERGKKNQETLFQIYRVMLAAQGAYQLFHMYILGVLVDTLPLDGLSGEQAAHARSAIGMVGLKLLLLAFNMSDDNDTKDLDFQGFRDYYKNLMTSQIAEFLSNDDSGGQQKKKHKKPSLLRHMPRRITDASMVEEATTLQMNCNALDWIYHKRTAKLSIDLSASEYSLGASATSFMDNDDQDIFPVTDEMKRNWAHDSIQDETFED